jgi:uridine phosphorylase
MVSMKNNASDPKDSKGRVYHLALKAEELGKVAIICGDPERVAAISQHLDNTKVISQHREYTTHIGYLEGERVNVVSHGIGGPAAAIAIEELARLGVKAMIRIGTCGTIDKSVHLGDSIIAEASVRLDGVTDAFVMKGYPAAATPEMTMALKTAADKKGKRYRSGIMASTDSFYVGQGRPGLNGYFPSHQTHLIEDLQKAHVLGFEMETSTLFTLGRVYALSTGAILAAIAHRETEEFNPTAGVEDSIEITISALRALIKQGYFKSL